MSVRIEGPTTITLTTTRRHCGRCRYLDRRMIRSGSDPEYSLACHHPDVVERRPYLMPELWSQTGKTIGSDDITPGWCPLLEEQP